MSTKAVTANDLVETLEWESDSSATIDPFRGSGWDLDGFAREQIRGLVRQVFFSSADGQIRQVVFSAVDPRTEVLSICRQVGEMLASEAQGSIAVVGGFPQILETRAIRSGNVVRKERADGSDGLRKIGTKVRPNLWWIPSEARESELRSDTSLHTRLGGIRREFDYSIIEAPAAAESHAAMAMSQFGDGIILVVSARYARRAVARKVKESLEGTRARILGTVLSDRVFPIPQAIYRRL